MQGVRSVEIQFEARRVRVAARRDLAPQQLLTALENAGYPGSTILDSKP